MADKMEENQKLKKLVVFSEELFQSSAKILITKRL